MKLHVVPTPVGNLEDITLRAIRTLKECDAILCEDTRQSQKLLNHLGISKSLIAYHKFNEMAMQERVIQRISAGQKLALISDGGTPGISDPGMLLIQRCIAEGITIETLPGATALIPALVNSGFDTSEFVFIGFLPHKKGRQTALKKIAAETRTQILYESPYRVLKLMQELHMHIGEERLVSCSREISKMFEETIRGNTIELITHFTQKEPKGEFVVVINALA
jgi:16S rRNA (cytidine1402-2'-O)-methyltransferase